jgi:hypothetical protein
VKKKPVSDVKVTRQSVIEKLIDLLTMECPPQSDSEWWNYLETGETVYPIESVSAAPIIQYKTKAEYTPEMFIRIAHHLG